MVSPDELEQLISAERFATFVNLAGGDRDLAADLYEWTGAVAGVLFVEFRTFEIVFRNCVDQALTDYVSNVAPHVKDWMLDPSWIPAIGHWWDKDADKALKTARNKAGGRNAPHGRVVAELTFGFWRYIVSGRYEESMWDTALDRAFVGIPGTSSGDRRRMLEQAMINLNGLRNRLAHHEPILKPWTRRLHHGKAGTFTLADFYGDLVQVMNWTTPNHAADLLRTREVRSLLAARPN